MKFKSYYWAIIAAATLVILFIAAPFILNIFEDPEESGTNPHTPEELAQLQAESVDYTPQIQAYTDLVNANPSDDIAMAGLGDIYQGTGKYSEAADWYNKAITVNPGEATYYGRLGEVYFSMGMIDVALRELEKGLALDPKNQAILLDIGSVHAQSGGNEALAKEYWQRAYDADPTTRYAHVAQQLLAGPQTSTTP